MDTTSNSSMQERIVKDLENAFKSKESIIVGTLRLLVAALHNKEIEKRTKGIDAHLTDDEALEVVAKEVKKRKEAMNLYMQGGRKDLADKEKDESSILEAYLPPQMSDEEMQKVVRGVVIRMGAEKNFGKLMGEAMKELKGKADAVKVSAFLKAELAKT